MLDITTKERSGVKIFKAHISKLNWPDSLHDSKKRVDLEVFFNEMAIRVGCVQATDIGGGGGENYRAKNGTPK